MKRFFIWIIALVFLVAIASVVVYKFYLPNLLANAIIKENESAYVPRYLKARIKKYKAPVNRGAEDVITSIHKSDVSLDELFEAIDNAEESQVYALVDEVNAKKPATTNEVFNIAKKHLKVDFDIEVLRDPFNKNVDMKIIKQGVLYANSSRNEQAVNPTILKSIAKKILLQKEKDYNKSKDL
jgi:hypothetical protein